MAISQRQDPTLLYSSLLIILLLTGNNASAHDHKQTIGIIVGATAGGLLGSQIGDNSSRDRHSYSRNYYRGKDNHHHDNRRGHNDRRYDKRADYHRHYSSRRYDNPSYYRRNYSSNTYYQRDNGSTKLFATATGVFVGALIGSEIGRYMDDVDQMRARQANVMAQYAPVGEQISWNNPQTHNAGSITPTRDGYSASGNYCREFYQTVSIGGRTENAYGTACQQPDGSWQILPSFQ